jgi:biotin operon repressor
LIPPLRYHTLAELSEHPELMAEPDPIVSPFLYRGRSTLLAGREKMGKSTLAAHAVAALSNGQEFLGAQLRRGRVLWYSLDEGMVDTVRRFLALGASPLDVMICPDRPTFEQVAEKVADFKPDVVVFDTLNELLPGMDLNRGEQVAPALRPYVQVLRDANVAGCILCHASKSRGEYLGDVRLGGVVDCVLTLKEPRPEPAGDSCLPTEAPRDNEEDGPRLLVGKSRWGGKIHLRLTSPDGRHYILGEAPLSLEVRLLRALRDSDLSGNDLQDRVSGNRQKIQHAIKELRDRGLIEQAKTRYRITPPGLVYLDGGAEPVPAFEDVEGAGTTFAGSVSSATSGTERAGTSATLLGTTPEPVPRKVVPAPHTPYPDTGTTSQRHVQRII